MRYQSHPGPPDGGAPALKSHVAETCPNVRFRYQKLDIVEHVLGIPPIY